jgi:hypothetical protein
MTRSAPGHFVRSYIRTITGFRISHADYLLAL